MKKIQIRSPVSFHFKHGSLQCILNTRRFGRSYPYERDHFLDLQSSKLTSEIKEIQMNHCLHSIGFCFAGGSIETHKCFSHLNVHQGVTKLQQFLESVKHVGCCLTKGKQCRCLLQCEGGDFDCRTTSLKHTA